MKQLFLPLILFYSLSLVFQNTGIIIDQNNNPLPGASVVLKGTTKGTTTDFDGNFTIDIKTGDILQISYIGFETTEVSYEGTFLNITLNKGVSLGEVLVTGNGLMQVIPIPQELTLFLTGEKKI